MPRYMLDTNMCIYLMKCQPPQVAERFAQCNVGDILISAITFAELEGAVAAAGNSQSDRQKLISLSVDILVAEFDSNAAIAYGPLKKAAREHQRNPFDSLIAAHAISLNAILVTNQIKDFLVYPGLQMENWANPKENPSLQNIP